MSKESSKANKQETRQALIDAGTSIILEKGFNHTGIEQVLKVVGVPKGSFYYYFKSKDDFGLSIIDYHADQLIQQLEETFQNKKMTALKRLRNYFECGRSMIEQNACRKGCLFGNLGQEMADQNETFRLKLSEVFCKWCQIICDCLKEAQQDGDIPKQLNAERLSEYMMFSWEGAVLRAKISKSIQPIDTYLHFIFENLLKA
jgi:TetR/AcrR family transcriptional regulator, transcriptional repressor for nem operon